MTSKLVIICDLLNTKKAFYPCSVNTRAFVLDSPSDSHRLACAVAGDQGDEPGDVGVLQRASRARTM